MAYSLNPKDLREELKTYKQPVYVASTQPAQQTVAPASTSQYRQVKRADGGTDFYNGNQKTTIEEFSKGTGNQVNAVRGNLAAGGSKFDQDILTKQYFETKDPEVTKFNTLNVDQQRERLAQLQGAAGRKDFNVAEDARNQRWASEQLANVEKFGTKKEGNLLTFGQDFVGGFVKPAQNLVAPIIDTAQLQQRDKQLRELYAKGGISKQDYNSAAQNLLQNNIERKVITDASGAPVLDASGFVQTERTTPLDFLGQVGRTGADAALTYSPVGAGYKQAIGLPLKEAAPQILKGVAKEGTAYTVANLANDALQGREITPGSLLVNAATGYGGAAFGAGAAIAKPGVQNVARTAMDVIPTPEKLTMAHPEIQALTDKGTELFNRRQALVDQGLSTNSAPYKQLDNAIKALGDEYNTTYQRVLNQSKKELQRGSIQVPGGKAPDDPNRSWNLSNQQDAGYKMFDESKSAAIKKMDEFRAKNNGEPFTAAQQKELEPLMKSMEDGLASAKQASQELSNPISATQSNPLDNSSFFVVGKDGQSSFGKRDLQRTLASAKERADKVGGVVRKGGEVIYDSKAQAPQVGKTGDWRDSVDNLKFGKNEDTNANILSEKQRTLRAITQVSRSDKELGDVLTRAEQLQKQGYLGDNANLAYDIMNNPAASSTTKARATKLYEDITKPASTPQPTKTPKQPATQKSAFEADLEAAGLTPYQKQNKAMREAVDQAVYETDPLLFESGSSGLFEGGIPRIKPSSIKEVTGLSARESGIPPRYLSEKDGRALDDIAAEFEGNRSGGELTMTSEDMLDLVKKELGTRATSREQKKLIAEMRNDPEIQKRAEVISRTDPESGLYIDEPLALQRENQIAADLEAAGIAAPRQAKTKFTRTVKGSAETSDKLRTAMRGKEGSYTTVTDEQRLFQSDKFLKSRSLKEATTDIKDRLIADKIDDQTASDAIAVAKRLDARSTTKSLQEATEIYEQLAEKFSKAGQLVQAASLLGNRTPEGLRFSAVKSLKKEGVTITPDMTKKIDSFIQEVKKTKAGSYENGLARNNLMQYVAKQLPQRKMSQILQVWKAGLLTSPRTTAGNLAANTAEAVLRKGYVDPLANILDAATAFLFTGQRSRKYTFRGIAGGTGEGIVKGIKYFKTGYDPRNPSQKFDVRNISYSDKPLGKAAEVYTQAVFRLMGAQDQPFYYAALRNSLYDQALTEASRQKLKGSAKSDFVKQFITEPQTKAMDLADKEARYAVFQNETALGKTASRLKSTEGIGGDIAEFLVPFSGVPSSIATRMIERTPIGWATEIVKQIKAKKFDQRAMTQAIANGSMVIPLVGAGVALANSGAMTLGYPTEKKERDLWEAEGKQPYSIKVGDQWLSTNYFQPAGNLLAAGAEYQNAINEGEDPETAYANALAGAGKAFTEQSFLKGVSGGINALTDPTRSAEKFAEQTAGSVVPNIIRTAARATDPVQREMNGIGDAVTAGIPGLRQTLPAKTNIYGDEVPRRGSMIDEIINPFKPSKDLTTTNPMTAELRSLQDQGEGITPTQATKSTFKDANGDSLLDDKQMLELNKKVAKQVSTEWKKVMEDPRYAMLSAEDKKTVLTRANDTAYGAVKSELVDVKLTARQKAYIAGEPVDYFDGIELTEEQKQAAKEEAKAKKTTAKKTTKSSGGRKAAKKNYKLNAFGDVSGEVSGNLRKLIEQATIKGV